MKQLDVDLTVNGSEIDLNPFVSDVIASAVMGMVSCLKGIDTPKDVVLKIRSE